MLIFFAAVVAVLFAFGGFFASVLMIVMRVEAVFLSNRDRIDRDFFIDLQNRLAELADRGKSYAFLLGAVCTLAMFPLEDFLAGDAWGKVLAMLIMWIKMIPLFILWNIICHRFAAKFSQESFAQAEKLTGLSKVCGRVVKRRISQGTLLRIIVQVGQKAFHFYPSAELLEKNVWGLSLTKGSKVVVYYPGEILIATHIIVIDPILEEPEHWQDPNPAAYVPNHSD